MRCNNCGVDYTSDHFPSSGAVCNDCITKYDATATDSVEESNLIACSDCGKDISRHAASCPNCGRPIRGETAKKQEISSFSPFAIASLCLGLLGLATPVVFVNFIGVASVILGILSLLRRERLMAIGLLGCVIYNPNLRCWNTDE